MIFYKRVLIMIRYSLFLERLHSIYLISIMRCFWVSNKMIKGIEKVNGTRFDNPKLKVHGLSLNISHRILNTKSLCAEWIYHSLAINQIRRAYISLFNTEFGVVFEAKSLEVPCPYVTKNERGLMKMNRRYTEIVRTIEIMDINENKTDKKASSGGKDYCRA